MPGFTNFGQLARARFHLLWAPRKLQVSPTLGTSQAAGFSFFWATWKRSRFQLLWDSSIKSASPPRRLQVSPTLGPSQAAGFTSFGPLGSAPGFSYFGPPQECQLGRSSQAAGFMKALQVSPTLGLLKSARFHQLRAPRECQVSPTLGPSEAASFTYFRPLASCRLQFFLGPLEALQVSPTLGLLKSARFHQLQAPRECQVSPTLAPRKLQVSPTLGPSQAAGFSFFWAPWKRSRFQLLWASSRVPGFTNFRPPTSARFHLLWAPRKLQVSPTLGPSQAAGFTSFGPFGSAPGFTYFGFPQVRSFASSKFHLL